MVPGIDTGLLIRALHFAADKHRDQRRKDNRASPYINHPIDCAQLLWEVGEVRDTTTIIAAVLHDTIEDTETTGEEIEAIFGPEIRSVVEEVTDDKSLEKHVRKRLQVEHAAKKTTPAKHVKIADKVSNLRDLLSHPPPSWDTARKRAYAEWAARVVEGLRGTNSALEATFDAVHQRCLAEFAD